MSTIAGVRQMNIFMKIFRILYVGLFAMLLFPVGWIEGLYMARFTGNNERGYGIGFILGVLFLSLPFIVGRLRKKRSGGTPYA